MTELLDLCYDVLIRILEEINPEDLAACAQTSWSFNRFIKGNTRLYKAHYLGNWDDPRRKPTDPDPAWVSEVQRFVRCRKIMQSNNKDIKIENFKFVTSTIDKLISTATEQLGGSLNIIELDSAFEDNQNLDSFMCRSSLYGRGGTESQKQADNEEDRQLSARLHCLYGFPTTTTGRRALSNHRYARSRVYDLRRYTDETKWGPFRDDGSMRIDWEMIESLMMVLGYNSGLCCRRFIHRFRPPWSEPFEGIVKNRSDIVPDYPCTLPLEPEVPLDLKDPYGVTGIYSRVVCFMDYNDLYNFNFSSEASEIPYDQPREPIATEEAIRHIMMSLNVTKVEAPSESANTTLPVVHFTGRSRSVDASWDPNANSRIRGKVKLTPEGEVRWTTVSIFYGGEERWRSEGIQVGGPRSDRGVVGTWFDKDYNPDGPAGPTAFWKVCEGTSLGGDEDSDSSDDWIH